MPSKTTTKLGRCIATVALALAAVVGPLAAQSDAASVLTSSSLLAPDLVSTGRTALYSATWVNQGNPTLTNTMVVITLPTGSALVSADPAVCAVSLPSGTSGPVVVTCQRENLASGASLTQQLFVQVPTVTVSTTTAVTAFLKGDEQASDREKSHTDTFPAPDRTLVIVPGDADAAGGCLRDGEAPLATRPGLSATNPLITTAGLAGSSGLVCVPVTVQERAATSPTDACGAGATCTTDIAITDFVPVTAQLPSSPFRLTFTVVATSKNMTWYKNGVPVVDCAGATSLPPDLSACVTGRSKQGTKSVQLDVLWRAGVDPTWRG
jgi:Domain of unknown function DUF11